MGRPALADCSSKLFMSTFFLLRLTFSCIVMSSPVLAEAADKRITLLLTGAACPQSRAALERKVLEVPGVRQINLHAVPDHVLIDGDTAVVDVELLASQVNAILATHPPCHATIMTSCISSDFRVTGAQAAPEISSIVRIGH